MDKINKFIVSAMLCWIIAPIHIQASQNNKEINTRIKTWMSDSDDEELKQLASISAAAAASSTAKIEKINQDEAAEIDKKNDFNIENNGEQRTILWKDIKLDSKYKGLLEDYLKRPIFDPQKYFELLKNYYCNKQVFEDLKREHNVLCKNNPNFLHCVRPGDPEGVFATWYAVDREREHMEKILLCLAQALLSTREAQTNGEYRVALIKDIDKISRREIRHSLRG